MIKKFFLSLLFVSSLSSAEKITQSTTQEDERLCLICMDPLNGPLFDIKNPGTRNAYLVCPEQATQANENHSNQYCESCLTVHLLRDPHKACPTCRIPGKITISKLKKIISKPSIHKIESHYLNGEMNGVFYRFTDFVSFSVVWSPLAEKILFNNEPLSLLVKAGTCKPHEKEFDCLPVILFTRWIHVAQSAPQLITQLKESYPYDENNQNIKNFLTLLEENKFPFSQLNTHIAKVKEEADIIEQKRTLIKNFLIIKNELLEKEYEKVHAEIQNNINTFKDKLDTQRRDELSEKMSEWNERIKEKLEEEQERLQDTPNKEKLLQGKTDQLIKEAITYVNIEERESFQKNQRIFDIFVRQCEQENLARKKRILAETTFAIKTIVSEEYLQEQDKLLKMQKILIDYKTNIYAILCVKKVDNIYIPEKCFPTQKPSSLNALENERGLKILLAPMIDHNDITTRFMRPEKTVNLREILARK